MLQGSIQGILPVCYQCRARSQLPVRYLQNVLLVIGTTALSTVLGIIAVAAAVGLVQKPGGEPWTRGFGQYVGGLACGAPLGAVVGLVAGIGFIRAQEDSAVWSPVVWVG